ncbi:uncharacterized protein LOC128671378 [Plodia interpunctella]|uniref:uncharacterized protein LOC128671378 n=1 Tax=Plodia interpunctella TaxID=58824 RepID=UPI002368B5AB|nr:uncharacterized protein LOC128671378 [Plodia interpunctella]
MFTRLAIFIVTIYSSTNGAHTKSDKIIYPGPTVDHHNGNSHNDPVIVPASCRNLTYCFEKPKNYPQERYDKMFEGMNLAPLPTIVESSLSDRLGDEEYEDDCDAEVRYDPLYSIRTKKGEWRHIIQSPKQNFNQKVRIETCTAVDTQCFKNYPVFGGIITLCKQKTAKYEFVADDGKGGSTKLETELPSCCVCHYKPAA